MQVVPNFESGQLLQEDQFWLWIKNKNSDDGEPPKGHSVSREKIWDLWVSRSRCQFALPASGLILLTFKWGELLQEDQFWLLIKNKNSDPKKPPKGHSVSRKNSGTSAFLDLVANLCHAHPDWFSWPSNEVNCYKNTKFDFWSKNKNSDPQKPPKGHSVSRKIFWDLWVSRSRCQFVLPSSGQENWERSDK